jgi:hypothetical protein
MGGDGTLLTTSILLIIHREFHVAVAVAATVVVPGGNYCIASRSSRDGGLEN